MLIIYNSRNTFYWFSLA